MTKTSAFVFARGGSKGLPGKNILPIAGKPMIAHSIETAQKVSEIDHIYVSTDCVQIASIARDYGAEVIERPSELATDEASEWDAWQHAIHFALTSNRSFDRFVSLPVTAPMRSPCDVHRCLSALQDDVDMVITITPATRSPWFNMVNMNENSQVKLILGNGSVKRRQDSKQCFDITTVAYVSRPKFILSASSIWDGNVVGVEITLLDLSILTTI